ncbi:MAG: purine-nucleoside phosphorylase [Anaerolineaceae bacterium]|nr:purine-nucleoside phosphorylase [Anaerolineaceae bacterium]
MRTYSFSEYQNAADVIRKKISIVPEIGLVLGSGLGPLADEVEGAEPGSSPVTIDYKNIPGWPLSTVFGHKGRLVIGKLAGRNVVVQQGRTHFYEGYSMNEVTFAVRVMKLLGVKTLVVTNAAGGVNVFFYPGEVMLIRDHIAFAGMAGNNPLCGPNIEEFGTRFPDMSQAYDREYGRLAKESAVKNGITLHEGTYAWLGGPSFETPAEIRMLRLIGVDAVGMSTAPEVIVARHCGMRVLGFSGITNKCTDNGDIKSTHEEVLESANIIGPKIITILKEILPKL